MRTDDARRVPVASTQKFIERGATTSSSTPELLFGRTDENAFDFKKENPAIRTRSPMRANAVRFTTLFENLRLRLRDSDVGGAVAGYVVGGDVVCGVEV